MSITEIRCTVGRTLSHAQVQRIDLQALPLPRPVHPTCLLGNDCPKLRRSNQAWSLTHGAWAYQLELPPTAEGRRRQLRRLASRSTRSLNERSPTPGG